MSNPVYDAGRDQQYASRLAKEVEAFCKSYENDTSTDRKAIFLFPGGMGSELVRSLIPYTSPFPHLYYLSWLSVWILSGEAKNLQIDVNGVDHEGKYVVPDGCVDFDFLFLKWSAYIDFIEWCKDQKIHLFIFGWDWRRGVQHTTDVFLNTLMPMIEARLGTANPLGDYTLIGHSAGGMVVKVVANQASNKFVQNMSRAITVGAPFYGCGNQVHLFIMGHPVLNPTIGGGNAAKTMAAICSSMAGGYEFLYLDESTYNANKNAFANDPEGYHLNSYPSMDKAVAGEVADPFYPIPGPLGEVRYPPGYGFSAGLLAEGLAGSRKVSNPLNAAIAAKFYCIRGVQKRANTLVQGTVVSQTWERVAAGFDPDTTPTGDPIQDTYGYGDGVEAAWSARLLGLPEGNVITVVDDIEHMTMMNAKCVQDEIADLMSLSTVSLDLTEPPMASQKSLNEFLTGLRREVTDKWTEDADRRVALAKYLAKFKPQRLHALLTRAYVSLLKSPSQIGAPGFSPKRGPQKAPPTPKGRRKASR